MNCSHAKCPHRALMEKARAACLACDHIEPAGRGGMVSFNAAGENTVQRLKLAFDRSPRGQVTELPADIEEKLADLFRRWCGLDTIDALLALHVCNGGTPATFGDYLARAAADIQALKPGRASLRATAWLRFKGLVRRFAAFDKVRTWDDGHGGAIRREREAGETPLFSDAGVEL